ncbi:conserved unknown protein [Ectocarpus siliculosus]|uniref:Uncharacterized protein n=1 Tax=Ectocarpus siliculosus TaxID=2880 RepID=D8LJK8_ECTSI|nr:conserved unknown protein [Ectocarpus siliculosus]|eukprot:CBN77035.1 conserved unknown protein [Ectocarpus siliculosus]
MYSCSRDTTVRQWNRSGISALRVFEGHDLACTAIALSEDEKTLYSGSRDTSIRAWDVQTGQCTSSAKVPRNLVTCLKCLSGGPSSSVVQGGEDLKLRVWDTREGGLRSSMTVDGYTFFPLFLDVSSDGHQVLTSCKGFNGAGCETKLWDLRSPGIPVREYTGHTQDTTACVFVTSKEGGDGGSGAREGGYGLSPAPWPSLSAPSSRGMIATASKDGTVKIYDLADGSILVDHVEPECGGYTGLAIQRDSRTGGPVFYASTITGGLYALRLEEKVATAGTSRTGLGEGGLRLRCVGFVRGNPIL